MGSLAFGFRSSSLVAWQQKSFLFKPSHRSYLLKSWFHSLPLAIWPAILPYLMSSKSFSSISQDIHSCFGLACTLHWEVMLFHFSHHWEVCQTRDSIQQQLKDQISTVFCSLLDSSSFIAITVIWIRMAFAFLWVTIWFVTISRQLLEATQCMWNLISVHLCTVTINHCTCLTQICE